MGPLQTILAATDFSALSASAIERAFDVASTQDGRVYLLHAYNVPPFPDGMAIGADLLQPVEQAALRTLAQQTDRYRSRREFGGVIVEMGDPREVILRHARALPADLIVIGTHGRHGAQRWLLGSVAEHVVRTAACPVLVIPGTI